MSDSEDVSASTSGFNQTDVKEEGEDILVKVEITSPPSSPTSSIESDDICDNENVNDVRPGSPECILGDVATQASNIPSNIVKLENATCSNFTRPRQQPINSSIFARRSVLSDEGFERMVSLLSSSSQKGRDNLLLWKSGLNKLTKIPKEETSTFPIKKITNPFKCTRCSKSFSVEHQLRSHHSICDPNSVECDICGENLKDEELLAEHKATVKCGICKECGKEFTDVNVFKAHKLLAHAEGASFKCSLCKVSFNRVFSLTNHIRKVHSKKSLECSICGKFLPDEASLAEHQKDNTCAKCAKCGKIFLDLSLFRAHMLSEHVSKGPCICHVCKRAFRSMIVLKQHIRKNHPPKTFDCSICGRVLPDADSLRIHEADQSCIKCYDCGKEFSTNSALKAHRLLTHPPDQFQKCTLCNRTFAKTNGLVCHLRKIHKEKYPYICKTCGHKSANLPKHKTHLKTHKQRPFPCPECDLCFTTRFGLGTHRQRIHEKNRPYACQLCNKSFAVKSFLTDHINYVHNPNKALKWQVRLESITTGDISD